MAAASNYLISNTPEKTECGVMILYRGCWGIPRTLLDPLEAKLERKLQARKLRHSSIKETTLGLAKDSSGSTNPLNLDL